MSVVTKYFNCNILKDGQFSPLDLWVENGKIIDPEIIFYDQRRLPDIEIDCLGSFIVPGFIDLQINGAFGYDFTHDFGEGLDIVRKGLLQYGVTGFCPTVVTTTATNYHKTLPKLKKCQGSSLGAAILGAHVEGPFISIQKPGAHNISNIKNFSQTDLYDTFGSLENISIVTLAPELDGSMEIIKKLNQNGIVVSMGHTSADFTTGREAVENGAKFVTHLFNAMLPFHHRDPGLIGLMACSSNKKKPIYFGLIADGNHAHDAALKIAHKINPRGLVLVTDALSVLGLSNGVHHLADKLIEVKDSKAYILNTKTLCGSMTSLNVCLQNFMKATDCSLPEAIDKVTLHPARVLGIEHIKGTLKYGADADFVFIEQDLNIMSTWIGGQCVYENMERPGYKIKKKIT